MGELLIRRRRDFGIAADSAEIQTRKTELAAKQVELETALKPRMPVLRKMADAVRAADFRRRHGECSGEHCRVVAAGAEPGGCSRSQCGRISNEVSRPPPQEMCIWPIFSSSVHAREEITHPLLDGLARVEVRGLRGSEEQAEQQSGEWKWVAG